MNPIMICKMSTYPAKSNCNGTMLASDDSSSDAWVVSENENIEHKLIRNKIIGFCEFVNIKTVL